MPDPASTGSSSASPSPTGPVTRFAPSPTGFLHIGGARTALFNRVLADAKGGRMLLRIEDTDRARSTQDAVDAILQGLEWLGVAWDGEPVSQASRAERHREVALQLVEQGSAYRCYTSPDELAALREEQRARKLPPRYDGRWRDRDPSQAPPRVDPVVRIRTPDQGETIVDDAVQGRVTFPNVDLDDFVLLRADGSPTYMLAVVVDDHDMGITQIVRGDDHLTNAARQTVLFQALGWDVPKMAHIPLIHGADGAKLSKRHGALGVEAYRDLGYLPEALRNYLLRLGWAHGDEEFFTRERLLEVFDLGGIGRSPSRFDFTKLENMNGHYIRHADDARLLHGLRDLLPHVEDGAWFQERWSDEREARLLELMPGLKERAKTLLDLLDGARFLFLDGPIALEPKAEAIMRADDAAGRRLMPELADALSSLPEWSVEAIEAAVRGFVGGRDLKLGKVAQPLRAALTGRTTSPGIFDVAAALGRDEALARMRAQGAVEAQNAVEQAG